MHARATVRLIAEWCGGGGSSEDVSLEIRDRWHVQMRSVCVLTSTCAQSYVPVVCTPPNRLRVLISALHIPKFAARHIHCAGAYKPIHQQDSDPTESAPMQSARHGTRRSRIFHRLRGPR